jgi:hypothetical protein
MTGKILGKMEVTRGFIQIPAVGKSELIGDTPLPCSTTVNGSPARLDARGRLWSDYLKGKFSVGDKVSLCKSEGGYQVSLEIDQQVMVPKKAESKKRNSNDGI